MFIFKNKTPIWFVVHGQWISFYLWWVTGEWRTKHNNWRFTRMLWIDLLVWQILANTSNNQIYANKKYYVCLRLSLSRCFCLSLSALSLCIFGIQTSNGMRVCFFNSVSFLFSFFSTLSESITLYIKLCAALKFK